MSEQPSAAIYGAQVELTNGARVVARFIYEGKDPYAFWVDVPTAPGHHKHIVRVASRDLLVWACHVAGEWVGPGNVQIKVEDGFVLFKYRHHTQNRGTVAAQIIEGIEFRAPAEAVFGFLALSEGVVAVGEERAFLDWPDEFAAIPDEVA